MLSFREYSNLIEEAAKEKLKEIHDIDVLRKDLQKYFVVFKYVKKDKTRREAYGTLREDFLKSEYTPSKKPKSDPIRNGYKSAKSMGYLQYFDLERGFFRSLRTENGEVTEISLHENLSDLVEKYPKMKFIKERYSKF